MREHLTKQFSFYLLVDSDRGGDMDLHREGIHNFDATTEKPFLCCSFSRLIIMCTGTFLKACENDCNSRRMTAEK